MQEQEANKLVLSLQDATAAVAPLHCMLMLVEAFEPLH
jgi:hypothetical protein